MTQWIAIGALAVAVAYLATERWRKHAALKKRMDALSKRFEERR